MDFRTDLALEIRETLAEKSPDGIITQTFEKNGARVTKIKIINEHGEKKIGKPRGTYITVEIPDDAFFYYDRQLKYGMYNGDYTISVGTSSVDIKKTFEVRIRNGLILTDE